MRVELNEQPWDALQARYRDALREVYDQIAIAEGRVVAPSKLPQHVFDTPTGIRLIIARERTPTSQVVLHVSASRFRGAWSPLLPFVCTEISVAFARLSGVLEGSFELVFVSEGGVPHFYVSVPTVH